MLALGAGSRLGSLSSRDIRLSAVKLPCESGDGRAGRGVGVGVDVAASVGDVVVGDVVVVGGDGDIPEERVADPVDDDEPFR